jgi:hypothetical protein
MPLPVRMILAVALVSATAAGTAGAASSRTAVLRGCGTVAGAGRTWQVIAAGVGCADAKALVRKLIPMVPASGVVRLGTYLTMSCTGLASASKHGITCVSAGGKLVYGLAK